MRSSFEVNTRPAVPLPGRAQEKRRHASPRAVRRCPQSPRVETVDVPRVGSGPLGRSGSVRDRALTGAPAWRSLGETVLTERGKRKLSHVIGLPSHAVSRGGTFRQKGPSRPGLEVTSVTSFPFRVTEMA